MISRPIVDHLGPGNASLESGMIAGLCMNFAELMLKPAHDVEISAWANS